jgi:hypothetical protein
MREDAVLQFLTRAGANWTVIETLIDEAALVEAEFGGQKFYMRRLKGTTNDSNRE